MAEGFGEGAPQFGALVRNGSAVGERLVVLRTDAPNTLGRSSARSKHVVESVKFPNMVSRLHATIELKDNQWHVTDHSTVNGTVVNGKVVASAVLENGARLCLGGAIGHAEGERLQAPATDVCLTFYTDESAAQAAAAAEGAPATLVRSGTAEMGGREESVLGKRSASDWGEGTKKRALGESSPTVPSISADAFKALAAKVELLQAQLGVAQQQLAAAEVGESSARRELMELREKNGSEESVRTQLSTLETDHATLKKAKDGLAAERDAEVQKLTEEVNSLKTSHKATMTSIEVSVTCCICKDYMLSPYALLCGCSFCEVCLHTSIRSSLQCPLCKASISRLPTKCRALAGVSEAIAKQNLANRELRYANSMTNSLATLKSHLANAKKKGCTFLNIVAKDWSRQDVAKFDSGIRLYHGACKREYLETIGFSHSVVKNLSPAMVHRAAANVGLRTRHWQRAMLAETPAVNQRMAAMATLELQELLDSPFFVTARLGGRA